MHHIKLHILRQLVHHEQLRYKDVKPQYLDPNLFMYHLKQLQKEGLVTKNSEGYYTLSSKGLLEADNRQLEEDKMPLYNKPRLVILLAVYDDSKGWLLQKRDVQPLIGRSGYIHANLEMGLPVNEIASTRLKQIAGLNGDFSYRGSATIATYNNNDEVESYVHAIIVYCENPSGRLIETSPIGNNRWVKEEEFSNTDVIPSLVPFTEALKARNLFYLELAYRLDGKKKNYNQLRTFIKDLG